LNLKIAPTTSVTGGIGGDVRILMVSRRFPPDVFSGTETVFQALYEQARARHEVRLVAGWESGREGIPAEAVGVRLRGMSKPNQWLAMARATRAEVKRWKPDVVLSNNIEVPPSGCPTVCIIHDLNFGEPGGRPLGASVESWSSKARRAFYGFRSRSLDRVVTVSEASRQALAEAGVAEDRITVIRNGVDAARFCPTDDRDGSDVTRFAYPSRILPGKGQHLAIDAIARLPRLHKRRAELHIVGANADRVYLDQIRVQSYDQPVRFSIDVADMVPHIQAADVILFPTVMAEGFGFTAVEAMACGKPVIWTDQPAIREATGGIGIAVAPEDVDGIRTAMKRLMDDPDERAAMGRAGREWVESNHSWDGVWERYERVLGSIAR
jgi:glycosyltransferase involved in cell wall biosynthesis